MTMRSALASRAPSLRWAAHILGYGALLALATFLLELADYRHRMMVWSTGFYVLVTAIGFAALGFWLGHRLTARPAPPFTVNQAAIDALGISTREYEVLQHLAAGDSNKHIARHLAISLNTVKTHVARLYEKLEVTSRTQAIARARELSIIA